MSTALENATALYPSLNNGQSEYVTTDFFDSDERGFIIEHWDVIGAFKGRTPSGHTEVDGSTEFTDLDKTEENKVLVQTMIENCLFWGNDGDRIEAFIAESLIQHAPELSDGRDAFKARVVDRSRNSNYHEIVLCVGRGNFVATRSRTDRQGVDFAQVDIFRIEQGRIGEHWDNAEPVPDHDVNGGKF